MSPLMRNSEILLDGVPTGAKFYFGQLWEYDPEIDEDVMVGEDRLNGQLYALVSVGFGTHTATAKVYNLAGQLTTYSWSFNVGGADTVGPITPADTSYITNRSPIISARVTSASTATPTITLDGVRVSATSYTGGIARYQASNLTAGAWHTAVFTAPDGVTSSRSEFFVHTGAPAFSAMSPTTASPSKVPNPLVSAMAADSVPLSTPGVGAVTLDGVIVPFTFTPQDVAKLRGEFRITTAGLANGTHAASMTVANVAGTPTTQNWDFKVAVAPTFSEFAPAASSTVITTTPTISVKVADNSVGGVTGGFTVDGVALPGTYSAATKTLSAHVPTAIPDGAHTAVVSVIDAAGVAGTSTWTFRTSALPVMPTAGTCSSCHPGYPTGHVAGRAACDACHDDLGAAPVDWTNSPHSGEDCTWCHTYANDPPVPFHPVAHESTTDVSSCTPCHSAELTVEHYRRTDATRRGTDLRELPRLDGPGGRRRDRGGRHALRRLSHRLLGSRGAPHHHRRPGLHGQRVPHRHEPDLDPHQLGHHADVRLVPRVDRPRRRLERSRRGTRAVRRATTLQPRTAMTPRRMPRMSAPARSRSSTVRRITPTARAAAAST